MSEETTDDKGVRAWFNASMMWVGTEAPEQEESFPAAGRAGITLGDEADQVVIYGNADALETVVSAMKLQIRKIRLYEKRVRVAREDLTRDE